jgi:hypothetical protein
LRRCRRRSSGGSRKGNNNNNIQCGEPKKAEKQISCLLLGHHQLWMLCCFFVFAATKNIELPRPANVLALSPTKNRHRAICVCVGLWFPGNRSASHPTIIGILGPCGLRNFASSTQAEWRRKFRALSGGPPDSSSGQG